MSWTHGGKKGAKLLGASILDKAVRQQSEARPHRNIQSKVNPGSDLFWSAEGDVHELGRCYC